MSTSTIERTERFPRLRTLAIQNFQGIRNRVEIDLDDIVILVGSNNSGKSTILRAYELAVNNEKVTLDDFPDQSIDADALPTVELHTVVNAETAPSLKEWCRDLGNNEYLVREKWTWAKIDKPERLGYRVDLDRWANPSDKPKQPWATDNVASSKRPRPHRISTFDTPETQADAIKALITAILEEEIKTFEPKSGDSEHFTSLFGKFESLKREFGEASQEKLEQISKDITAIVTSVIPNHEFRFSIRDTLKQSAFTIFDSEDIDVRLGDSNSMLPIASHGSGARRTLMWAVLKKLADLGYEAKSSAKGKKFEETKGAETHLLLLDEPEISLHPQAIRDACKVLYSLPNNPKWQVMVTTHSPYFIDLTQDHTTISRVECSGCEENRVTNLFRADAVQLTTDEKDNLKLLNLVDPHVLEFFFGGRVILVEGDTEYSSFCKVKQELSDAGNTSLKDLLIIRARGKVQVAALMKILNHFKKRYFVLHDTDFPRAKSKRRKSKVGNEVTYDAIEIANPAWTNNAKIAASMSDYSVVCASIGNFELAAFGEQVLDGKPENAIEKMKDQPTNDLIKSLLVAIVDAGALPGGFIRWTKMEELDSLGLR